MRRKRDCIRNRVCVFYTPTQRLALWDYCEIHGISYSEALRQALSEWLTNREVDLSAYLAKAEQEERQDEQFDRASYDYPGKGR